MHKTTLPPLLYGTAWKKEKTADLVEMAVNVGFRGIDTACQPKHYHEAGVGDALKRLYAQGFKREDFFLQTKFTPLNGQDPNNIPYNPKSSIEEQIATSLEVSKQHLQTDFIDSLLLHSPIFPYSQLVKAWNVMERFVALKEVGQLGISNCYDLSLLQQLCSDAAIKPSIVQNRFYADTGYDKELRKWCQEQGIFYEGFWTLTANPHILSHPTLQAIAQTHTASSAQVWYRYLNQKGIVPLIGSTSQQHLKEDLAIFEFSLSEEESTRISALL